MLLFLSLWLGLTTNDLGRIAFDTSNVHESYLSISAFGEASTDTNKTWTARYFPLEIVDENEEVFRLEILSTNRYTNPPVVLKWLPIVESCPVCGAASHHERQIVDLESWESLTLQVVLKGYTNQFAVRGPSTNWFATNTVAKTRHAQQPQSPPPLPK